ncbi:hypothetical protein MKW94_015783, partial [Papaver nudicaule]|nr:hypothetical protein [Papaver nudicaule]
MAVDSETREERKRKAQMELKDLRAGVRDLLEKESLQSKDLSGVLTKYVLFLNRMPIQCYENKSDVVVDLDILKELGRICEHESDKAKQKYFERLFSSVYALRKKAMMQLKLRGILESPDGTPDAFREKCSELLEDSDWDDIIKDTNYMEKEWKTQADETNENVAHLLIDTIEADPINVNDPDQVKRQFTSYSDKVTKFSRDMNENLSMCVEAPKKCQSVKKLVRFLEKSCSSYFIPADDIKVDKASQEVHCSIQSEDGGRADKGSRDVHCSMQSKDGGR